MILEGEKLGWEGEGGVEELMGLESSFHFLAQVLGGEEPSTGRCEPRALVPADIHSHLTR